MKKLMLSFLLLAAMLLCCGCGRETKPLPVKVLIVPHFEIGEMEGDDPGEAQMFFEEYFKTCDEYKAADGTTVYYNSDNGAAMYLTGVGKVNAAASTAAVLSDDRFDFGDAYLVAVGCSGSAIEYATLGDVILESAVCDFDLGHTADIRELEGTESVWFASADYDDAGCKKLNADTLERAYELTKDIPLMTTEISLDMLRRNFPGEDWAARQPAVIKGASVTSDNYWKGRYSHDKAVKIAEYYGCPDPYASTEMEDLAIASAAERFGLLDRTAILRTAVNIDVFYDGATPESLWGNSTDFINDVAEENEETLDIFLPAMENLFKVGKAIIDPILRGEF